MKKLFNSEDENKLINVYEKLQNNRKKIKRRAIMMVILLFGINAFAWFAYIAQADFNFDATVVSWDVNFYNDSTEVSDVVIDVGEIYPGYGDTSIDSNNIPYSKIIEVSNTGEVPATFSYSVKSFTIMGMNAIPSEYTTDNEILNMMETYYPFTIKMSSTSNKLAPNEKLSFEFNLYWLYEESNKYFKLNSFYTYDPSVVYYNYLNNAYVAAEVTEANFDSLKNTLYLEKDDADSFFGSQCAVYEANTGEKCVSVDIELKVSQSLE